MAMRKPSCLLAIALLSLASASALASVRTSSRVARSAVRMADPWELRLAGPSDAETIGRMAKLPAAVVSTFVAGKATVVATDLDGKVIAYTLVNTFRRVKNKAAGAAGGMEMTGEIMKTGATEKGKDYQSKTTLGAMKILKGLGGSEIMSTVSSTDSAMVRYFAGLGFTDEGRRGDFITMKANMFAVSSDPGKKIEGPPVVRKPIAVAPPTPAAEAPADEAAAAAEEVSAA
jgi:L-amino acid N-acyltransferase YncA